MRWVIRGYDRDHEERIVLAGHCGLGSGVVGGMHAASTDSYADLGP